MKKNLLNELSQMKFMFDYKPGKIISEQNFINEEDIDFPELEDIDVEDVVMADPDVMEPDVKPRTRPRPETPDTDPFPNPFDPDRSREFDPLPDAEPQGRRRERMMADPDVMEPDVKPRTRPRPETPDTDPFPNPFDPDRSREFDPLPDAEPQGRRNSGISGLRSTRKSEVNEPFIEDTDDYRADVDLESLVSKYLRGKRDEVVYEIHLNGDISELFDL